MSRVTEARPVMLMPVDSIEPEPAPGDPSELEPAAAEPVVSDLDPEFLDNLPEEAWCNMLTFLNAKVIARLLRTAQCFENRLAGEEVARWCAESRQALLRNRAVRGDMPLGFSAARWTLERVHLCEVPPRFPNIYFGFCQDTLNSSALRRLDRVARVLVKHPQLRIRIEGFADPSAPDEIGRAISQARAVTVRSALLHKLKTACVEWKDEDAEEGDWSSGSHRGFRQRLSRGTLGLYETRSVGKKMEAIGRWGDEWHHRNENLAGFQSFSSDGEEEQTDRMDNDSDFDVNRRVDFTVLSLGDEPIDAEQC